MKNFKSHFQFSKQERSGIFYLLLLIVTLQIGYYFFNTYTSSRVENFTLNTKEQAKVDSLKSKAFLAKEKILYVFNPNYITDYKGYTLGMSVEEIDRLHLFRKKNGFVNSAEEFQQVTKISDSLLKLLEPYFKFPKWKKKTSRQNTYKDTKIFPIKDLNDCTEEELQAINGIGEVLSKRIVKFRNALGGFLIDKQLLDVYGLKPEVAERLLKQYKVMKAPEVKKININTATASELSKLLYIQKTVAFEVVNYRNLNDSIVSFDELANIKNFPFEKIDKIKLYLKLK
ncbi:helix-hairpin-helix domain-containing protein [uncultured Maribacter sp.]|uniref:ComEA family DNA-binding protein n=1 Tax=uncultured Maribacter sp. TaxID=431308 RepID=UPI00261B964E|nr:helix-hairpin-helix domain-containing protein [uncultured Maribacter sp.]